jgi:hypothetical protein
MIEGSSMSIDVLEGGGGESEEGSNTFLVTNGSGSNNNRLMSWEDCKCDADIEEDDLEEKLQQYQNY